MARVEKEVVVNAPIEKVFNYINKPDNLLEFWPSLIEVKDVKLLPNGGYSAQWSYKMAGMRFEGRSEHIQVIPNQWIIVETTGGVSSTITWTFRSMPKGTRVNLTIEYRVPIPLLGKLAEAVIVMMNEQEGDLMMANLRARFIIG